MARPPSLHRFVVGYWQHPILLGLVSGRKTKSPSRRSIPIIGQISAISGPSSDTASLDGHAMVTSRGSLRAYLQRLTLQSLQGFKLQQALLAHRSAHVALERRALDRNDDPFRVSQ